MKAACNLVRILAMGTVVALSTAVPSPASAAQSPTAGAAQQSNQSSDIDITRNIRRALIKDKTLSTAAHNVTIITKAGKVTQKAESSQTRRSKPWKPPQAALPVQRMSTIS